jgi:hypothetical protein
VKDGRLRERRLEPESAISYERHRRHFLKVNGEGVWEFRGRYAEVSKLAVQTRVWFESGAGLVKSRAKVWVASKADPLFYLWYLTTGHELTGLV